MAASKTHAVLALVLEHLRSEQLDSSRAVNLAEQLAELPELVEEYADELSRALTELANKLKVPASFGAELPFDHQQERDYLSVLPSLLTLANPILKLALEASASAAPTLLPSLVLALSSISALSRSVLPPSFAPRAQRERHLLPSIMKAANEALAVLLLSDKEQQRTKVADYLLRHTFPGVFRPPAGISAASGRARTAPTNGGGAAGGGGGMPDLSLFGEQAEEQWRSPGMAATVDFVLTDLLNAKEAEARWPLLLPPVLAYGEDHRPLSKLVGCKLVNSLLDTLGEEQGGMLLKRTGVGEVLLQVVGRGFNHLDGDEGVALFGEASRLSLRLVLLLYPPPSSKSSSSASATAATITRSSAARQKMPKQTPAEAHFLALSSLLSRSVLNLWTYRSGTLSLELAGLNALLPLLRELRGGAIRWLQVMVPHLCGLVGAPVKETEVKRMAVEALLWWSGKEGRGRMKRWSGDVLVACVKAWVVSAGAHESDEEEKKEHAALRGDLRALVRLLKELDGSKVAIARKAVEGRREIEGLFE